ncbi:MAG: hypothetical protein U0324_24725 [Polyangiales bacterium]
MAARPLPTPPGSSLPVLRRLVVSWSWVAPCLAVALLQARACAPSPDDARLREMRRILACDGHVDTDARRLCFGRLVGHMFAWPGGAARQAAMEEALGALSSWTAAQRSARSQSLLHVRERTLSDVARLPREVVDWYPDDTGQDASLAARLLFGSPYARDLERYEATRAHVSFAALARGPGAAGLRALHLGDAIVHTEDWGLLLAWPGRLTLEHLALVDEPLAARREDFWRFCDEAPALRSLRLDHSGSVESIERLAARPALSARLEALSLTHCHLRDGHLDGLIANARLARLRVLDLRQNRDVTREGVARLKAAPQFAHTEVLAGPW